MGTEPPPNACRLWSVMRMLSDIERKVLRIIANFSVGRRRTPTVDELYVKTGRSRSGVIEVLAALAREEYIEWDRSRPDDIKSLEAWERKVITRWGGR
jgi:SOS-response transcriptional repressor LexA